MSLDPKELRIALLVRRFPALSETFILSQVVDLLQRGYDLQIFAEEQNKSSIVHEEVHRCHALERTYYAPELPRKKWMRRIKTVGLLCLHLLSHPVDLLRLCSACLLSRGEFDYTAFRYGLCFLGKRFNILHAHFGPLGNVAIRLKNAGFGSHVLTTFHGADVNRYPQQQGADVYEQLFKVADGCTVNTRFTGKKVQKLGCSADKIQILPVGLDVHQFPFRERTFPKDGIVRILTVGRLVEKKGHSYMLQALKIIVQNHKVHYTIVGDGPLEKVLRDQVQQLQLEKYIEFTGPLSSDQVRKMYDLAHLFVLPSVTSLDGDMEGQGLVLQEAQAMGIPVVSTYHNGIPDGILEGQSGFLVPEKDSKALAKIIIDLIQQPENWKRMGQKGRAFVEENYDIQRLNQQLEKIYLETMKPVEI